MWYRFLKQGYLGLNSKFPFLQDQSWFSSKQKLPVFLLFLVEHWKNLELEWNKNIPITVQI